jgi:hypothetical protein
MRLVDRVSIKPCVKSRTPAPVSAETGSLLLKDGRTTVQFQSTYERAFVEICDFAPEVQSIRWEPFSFHFRDLLLDKDRIYTPDYHVQIIDRRGEIYNYVVEVKRQTEYDRIWKRNPMGEHARPHIAAINWCKLQRNWEMIVITDRWVASRGIGNIRAITAKADYATSDELMAQICDSSFGDTGISSGTLIDVGTRGGASRAHCISTLLHLCAMDLIHFDITGPFNERTLMYDGPRQRVFRR